MSPKQSRHSEICLEEYLLVRNPNHFRTKLVVLILVFDDVTVKTTNNMCMHNKVCGYIWKFFPEKFPYNPHTLRWHLFRLRRLKVVYDYTSIPLRVVFAGHLSQRVLQRLLDVFTRMEMVNLRRELKQNNQEHLLQHWESLNEKQKSTFCKDLRNIDFAKINRWFDKTINEVTANEKNLKGRKLKPIPPLHVGSTIGAENENKVASWREKGLQMISEGKVAVLLLAGGQGTRLGVPYPKGMYNVGLPSQKTLYQLQAERILKVQELAYKLTGKKGTVPW